MNLALFDFDGTLTLGDTFVPFVHFAAPRHRVAFGTLLLSPLIVAYKLGLLPATRLRAAIAYVGFRGRAEADLNACGDRYAKTLPHVLRAEALAKLRWHQAQGDEVVIVSASLHPYLHAFCREHELGLICTRLECKAGILTGSYEAGDCTGGEKARRVLARYDLSRYPVVYAYGDTPEDHELLSLASKRFYRWRELPSPLVADAGGPVDGVEAAAAARGPTRGIRSG